MPRTTKDGTKQSAEKTSQLWCVNWRLLLAILVMQRGKSINISVQQNSGPFCLYYAFSLMAVTLAKVLAGAWQPGPSDAKQVSLAGEGVVGPPGVLIVGKGGCRHCGFPPAMTPRLNRATCLPRYAKSRQVRAKAWYL